MSTEEKRIYESVSKYYGEVLKTTKDLQTSACTTGKPPKAIQEILSKVPSEILESFYGCGNPIPMLSKGLTVLDLGSGSGRDIYIVSKLVGETGKAIGIDMTDKQLKVARKHVESYCVDKLGYKKPNMKFVKGYIEFLQKAGIEKKSIDVVISNCVLNLSPNKKKVLKEVYQVLKEGGEFYFSDVFSDRRVPEELRRNELLYGECISGALYVNDFKRICKEIGFLDQKVVKKREIELNEEMRELLGETKFYSITYRLFKIADLEPNCEDYGQIAIYKGNMEGSKWKYALDGEHIFETKKPLLICGNTAKILTRSWLAPYFTIIGDYSTHYGEFDCSMPCSPVPTNESPSCDSSSCGC